MLGMLSARITRKVLCSGSGMFPVLPACKSNKTIYLTFDDGPEPEVTSKILDVLNEHNIKATFFVIGNKAEKNPDLLKRMSAEGHAIGNHTFSHKILPAITRPERFYEFEECHKVIAPFQNYKVKLFRPPQGLVSFKDSLYLLKNGYKIMLWTVDSNDYIKDKSITARLHNMVTNNSIVLFHDDNDYCIAALKATIPYWLENGFVFATLAEPDMNRQPSCNRSNW